MHTLSLGGFLGRLMLSADTVLSVADYVVHNEVCVTYCGVPFGEGGALHHIGTRGGRTAWSNPHVAGMVVASMSSVGYYGANRQCDPRKIVGRTADGYNFTRHLMSSWVAVDLGSERTMRVSHYCLRHGKPCAGCELRNWELQARASEGDGWTTLRRHDNDASLDGKARCVDAVGYGLLWTQGRDSVAAFEVMQHTSMAFRYFRLYQHGPHASGHYHLMCGGLELYGTLLDGALYG